MYFRQTDANPTNFFFAFRLTDYFIRSVYCSCGFDW